MRGRDRGVWLAADVVPKPESRDPAGERTHSRDRSDGIGRSTWRRREHWSIRESAIDLVANYATTRSSQRRDRLAKGRAGNRTPIELERGGDDAPEG